MATAEPTETQLQAEIDDLRLQLAIYDRDARKRMAQAWAAAATFANEQKAEFNRVADEICNRRRRLVEIEEARGPPEPGTLRHVMFCEAPTPAYGAIEQALFTRMYRLWTPQEIEDSIRHSYDGVDLMIDFFTHDARRLAIPNYNRLIPAIILLSAEGQIDTRWRILWLKNFHQLNDLYMLAIGRLSVGRIPAELQPPIGPLPSIDQI